MTEELISKQRNILMDLLGSCMDLGKTSSVDVWKLHIDAAIDRLDQAYKGYYVQIPTATMTKEGWIEVSTDRGVRCNGVPLMTGQEWYDRYQTQKGFGSLDNLTDMPHSKDYADGIDHAVLKCDEAAARAAGLAKKP